MNILSLAISTVFFSTLALANETQNNPAKNFTVRYASSPWNKNSTSVDSAFMFIRDQKTGRIVKILLDESEPDSSLFSGRFSVNWDATGSLAPEVYIPPQNLRNDAGAIERFNTLLKTNQITAQPLMIRTDNGQQTFEVYDTKEQATAAKGAYEKELAVTKSEDRANLVKPQPDENSLQAAKMAAQSLAAALLAKEAALREIDRVRMEQLELQKIEQRRNEQNKLAKAELAARKAKAKSISQNAVVHYQKGEFDQAAALFEEAVQLDPNNKEYYYMYGVSLYRIEKFDNALVILKIAGSNPATDLEKEYYIGLIHFRLKELASARNAFQNVKKAKHPTLSPSAGFYEGLVYFSEENLPLAQNSFEYVIDTSKDPALDNKAEEYLEKIAKLIQFKKMAEKKIMLTADVGLNYDSNILFAPDNDTSTASSSDMGGLRTNLGGSAEYRFFYKEASDYSAKFALANTRSFSTDFVQADPLTASFTTPYNLKGVLENNKGYRLALTPGFETLYMDFDRSETMTNLLNTAMINADFMVVMRDDWFSSYIVDVRYDDSRVPGGTGTDQDADAVKIGLTKSEMFFTDSSKKKAFIGNMGFVINNAKGDEKVYDRIEFGVIYTAPLTQFKNTAWNTGLNAYIQNYGASAANRRDTNVALAFGTTKTINEQWSWSTNATYTNNASSEAASEYNKYSVLASAHYAWSK